MLFANLTIFILGACKINRQISQIVVNLYPSNYSTWLQLWYQDYLSQPQHILGLREATSELHSHKLQLWYEGYLSQPQHVLDLREATSKLHSHKLQLWYWGYLSQPKHILDLREATSKLHRNKIQLRYQGYLSQPQHLLDLREATSELHSHKLQLWYLGYLSQPQHILVRKLLTWKEAMEEKGLRVNAGKTKIMICGTGLDLLQSSGEFPCAVCRTGVGSNSIFKGCKHWVHKSSGLKCLTRGPWLQVYTVPGNSTPLRGQTTERSLSRVWQTGRQICNVKGATALFFNMHWNHWK